MSDGGLDFISDVESWNLKSVDTIASLQENFAPYEDWIIKVSLFGDNREAFTFFFPLVVGFANEIGARALWAAILAEWSNLLLKWMFRGDRPYWWVGESTLYTNETRPNLRQFPNTCESGPGTPSGHIMMNVAMFYVIAMGLCKNIIWQSNRIGPWVKSVLSIQVILAYIVWISLIFVSRLYIQAHFVHQCVFGIIAGLICGHIAWSSELLMRPSKLWTFVIANIMVGSTIFTYIALLKQGYDPLWTIPLAMKYCARPDYVKIDTQPFYIVMRFTGSIIGLGCGIATKQRALVAAAPSHFIRIALGVKVGLLLGRLASVVQSNLPTDDLLLFLAISLTINTMIPFVVISVLPYFFLSVYPPH